LIVEAGKVGREQVAGDVTKDSQTDESRTAEVASELILKDKVDIITASRIAGGSSVFARLSTSIATSNSACWKPIGCVHGRLVALT